MIMPAELAVHPEQLVHLFEELEAFILGDISRRVAKTGELTATAQIQTRVLRELGGDLTEVKKRVVETTKLAAGVADKMFNDVIMESFDRERTTFGLAGKSLSFSTAKYNILQASVKDIRGQFLSMTGSIGMAGSPLEEAYHKAVNTAYLQVSTGASDYVSAIKRQVKTLAADGLRLVNYDKHNDHADVAVRRAVVTGLADATQKISMLNAQELGAELVEVSAHAGARPDHAEWQGRVYSLTTANKKYPDFYRATGYGTGGGLGGYNCRHSFFAFFEGMTTQWTEEQLANIDGKPFVCTLDGKTYTAWEAAQKQRSIERAIRQTKREILGYAEAGDKDAELIARLKLQEQMEVYEQFSGEAGLLLQKERLGVISVKPGGAVTVNKLDKSLLLKDAPKAMAEKEKVVFDDAALLKLYEDSPTFTKLLKEGRMKQDDILSKIQSQLGIDAKDVQFANAGFKIKGVESVAPKAKTTPAAKASTPKAAPKKDLTPSSISVTIQDEPVKVKLKDLQYLREEVKDKGILYERAQAHADNVYPQQMQAAYMNEYMRTGVWTEDLADYADWDERSVNAAIRAVSKSMTPLPKTLEAVRCIDLSPEQLSVYRPGAQIMDKAFMSASVEVDKNIFTGRTLRLELTVPKGYDAYITKNFDESEIVLRSNTTIRVIETRETEIEIYGVVKKQLVVKAEVIQ